MAIKRGLFPAHVRGGAPDSQWGAFAGDATAGEGPKNLKDYSAEACEGDFPRAIF